jgi:hypothetical protein
MIKLIPKNNHMFFNPFPMEGHYMTNESVLDKVENFEIELYKTPKDKKSLAKSNVSFSGSPQKHPYDADKVILVVDPYSSNTFYYEFNKSDITFVEELPNIVNLYGDVFPMVRIWVRKMSVAVRCTPFVVADLRG